MYSPCFKPKEALASGCILRYKIIYISLPNSLSFWKYEWFYISSKAISGNQLRNFLCVRLYIYKELYLWFSLFFFVKSIDLSGFITKNPTNLAGPIEVPEEVLGLPVMIFSIINI